MYEQKNTIERLVDTRDRDVRHIEPCTVLEFVENGEEEPFVNVRIALDRIQREPERQTVRQEWVEILEVPIAYASTSTSALTMPINQGDSGLLLFSDRDMDEWQFEDAPTSAQGRRRSGNINDAIYVPALWKRIKGIQGYNQEAAELRSISGKARVIVGDDFIHMKADNIIMNDVPIVSVNPLTGTPIDPSGDAVPVNRP